MKRIEAAGLILTGAAVLGCGGNTSEATNGSDQNQSGSPEEQFVDLRFPSNVTYVLRMIDGENVCYITESDEWNGYNSSIDCIDQPQ